MKKKIKKPKARSLETLTAILHCKASKFHDKRDPRGGSKNIQSDLLKEFEEEMNVSNKIKLLIYKDDQDISYENKNVCAHCVYFGFDQVHQEGSCYQPNQSYVQNTKPIDSCQAWSVNHNAEFIKDSSNLPVQPEVWPAKFQFLDEDDNDGFDE